jgi:uncharacterized protein
MTEKDTLKEIILDNIKLVRAIESSPRGLQIRPQSGIITTIIGPRRAGKTVLLQQIARELIDTSPTGSTARPLPLYVNFEDERLNLRPNLGATLLSVYQELNPKSNLSETALFFDEIQNLPEWEKFIRRCHDSVTPHIFLTGSNAKILSTEIASALRGRGVARTVWPLTFNEYLRFKKINGADVSSQGKGLIGAALQEFLQWGGFPAVALLDNAALKLELLQEYFNVMVIRDLIERYSIESTPLVKFFLKRLLASDGRAVSVNKIFRELKSHGMTVGKNKLYEWFDYAQDIFLVQLLRKDTAKVSERDLGEKRLYSVDNGLLHAVTGRHDATKALENIVFRELRARNTKLAFHHSKNECDFVISDAKSDQPDSVIQVSYTLADLATRKREIAGAVTACTELGLTHALIITQDDADEELNVGQISISIRPFIRWALELERTW